MKIDDILIKKLVKEQILYSFSYMRFLKGPQIPKERKYNSGCQWLQKVNRQFVFNRHRVSFGENEMF